MSALFTDEQREALLANGRNPGRNVFPVVKLALPGHEMVWLLTEINPGHENIAYGLCDLGLGFPEVGSVDLSELAETPGRLGRTVERDTGFQATKRLNTYANEARAAGRITV
jgi:hypothetical protein